MHYTCKIASGNTRCDGFYFACSHLEAGVIRVIMGPTNNKNSIHIQHSHRKDGYNSRIKYYWDRCTSWLMKKIRSSKPKIYLLLNQKKQPLIIGRGGSAQIELAKQASRMITVKAQRRTTNEVKSVYINQTKEILDDYKSRRQLTESQYCELSEMMSKTADNIKTPEQECYIAGKCKSRFVLSPEIINEKLVSPLHGGSTRSVITPHTRRDSVKKQPRLSSALKVNMFKQMMSGVAAMHREGYAHNDLKPENFLVNQKAEIKLIDFGSAEGNQVESFCKRKEKLHPVEFVMLQYGSTPTYMAPDQLNYKSCDKRACDIWSMGIVLTEVLLEKNYFLEIDRSKSEKMLSELKKRKNKAIKALTAAKIDPDAIELVKLMLCVEPDKRITAEQALKSKYLSGVNL